MKDRRKLMCSLPLIVLLTLSVAISEIEKVPLLDNLSQSQAEEILNQSKFEPHFKYCFSDIVKKHYIIPGTQDPEADTPYKVGGLVNVTVSLGPLPVVIGKSEDEARAILDEFKVQYEIIRGRNSSVPNGIIYAQDPIKANCTYPNFLKIKLLKNASLNAFLFEPRENESVSGTVLVRGDVFPDLLPGEYLWIAVKPYDTIMDWWPQSYGPIEPINGYFEGYASLAGNKGDLFEIAVLLVDNRLNQIFRDYENHSSMANNWPPITRGDPITSERVSKYEIEKRKLAHTFVRLKINASAQ